jgi:hypothetical protein
MAEWSIASDYKSYTFQDGAEWVVNESWTCQGGKDTCYVRESYSRQLRTNDFDPNQSL